MQRRRRTAQTTIKPAIDVFDCENFMMIDTICGWQPRNVLGQKCMNVNINNDDLNQIKNKKKRNKQQVVRKNVRRGQRSSQFLQTCGSWTASTLAQVSTNSNTGKKCKKMSVFEALKCQARHLENEDESSLKKLPDFTWMENFQQTITQFQSVCKKQPSNNEQKPLNPKKRSSMRAMSSNTNKRKSTNPQKQRNTTIYERNKSCETKTIDSYSDLMVNGLRQKMNMQEYHQSFRPMQNRILGGPGFKNFWSQHKRRNKIQTKSTNMSPFYQKVQGRKLNKLLNKCCTNATIV